MTGANTATLKGLLQASSPCPDLSGVYYGNAELALHRSSYVSRCFPICFERSPVQNCSAFPDKTGPR